MSNANWPDSVAFIGGGNMARSLIGGLLQNGYDPKRIFVADPYEPTRKVLADDFNINVYEGAPDAAANASCWMLAVKPQVMDEVTASLREVADTRAPLVISIAAGIPVDRLRKGLGENAAIVRTMPNTPALIGLGATGLYAGDDVSDAQRLQAQSLMEAAGIVEWIDNESLMDSVTALSGSGPAYVFLLAEAMANAAIEQGIQPRAAVALANQTIAGAAQMLLNSDVDAVTLRQRVTSPNGTTQAAIESFERDGLRDVVQRALDAARDRGIELAKG